MWYRLALLGAACIVFVIGWLAFDRPDAGLYATIVATVSLWLRPPNKQ